MLHLRAFSQRESILDIDAEVANRALDLRMAEQNLHGTQVTCLLVDDGRLRLPGSSTNGSLGSDYAGRTTAPTHFAACRGR